MIDPALVEDQSDCAAPLHHNVGHDTDAGSRARMIPLGIAGKVYYILNTLEIGKGTMMFRNSAAAAVLISSG